MTDKTPNIDSLFTAAQEIESPEERMTFLQKSCGDNKEFLAEINQMLAAHGQLGSFLEKRPSQFDATIIGKDTDEASSNSPEANQSTAPANDSDVVIGAPRHSVLRSLGNTLSEVPQVSLRDSPAETDDPIARPNSSEVPQPDSDSRYRLDGEIARGGMGAILKGRDTDLGRDLAIKVLLDSHKDRPEVIQRFIEEAQIGGQLQHPGIAPVYELGQFADQRPFFAMKLVKGQTLSELLTDRNAPADERSKFIGIFEQICQTVAYAHSRGVIHRDLKPANIMVGAFGEVQVMDWGLAKVLASGGVADEKAAKQKRQEQSIIATRRSVGSSMPGSVGSVGTETQMGSVMGTPAYMPPEQALSEIDQLDQRADVFGLGAILCEILTGQPPYVGDDGTQVFRMASRGKLDDALTRLENCEADAELISLSKQCLAAEPEGRRKNAGALAEGVTGYLEAVETKLRDTQMAKVEAQTRAEEISRRQKLVFRAGATIAATLLVGIIVSGWQAVRATRAETRATDAAQQASDEASRAIAAELKTKETLVQVAAERDAKDQARKDAEGISAFLTEVFQSPDPARDGRTITVAETLDVASSKLETDLADQPDRRAKLQATLAKTHFTLGLYKEAIPLQEKVRDNYLSSLGLEQPETLMAMHVLATSYVKAGRRDEALQIQEEVLALRHKLLGSEHPDTLQSMHALAISYFYVGRRDEALQMQEEALKLHRKVLGPEHSDTRKVMPALAVSYLYAGRRDEALQMQEEVLALHRKLLPQEHPRTLTAMTNLASYYAMTRRLDEALQLREEVLQLSQDVLGQQHPNTLLAMQNLSTSYFDAGRLEEALEMREEVLTLRRELLGQQHPATVDAMENVAMSYFKAKRQDEAIQMQEQVVKVRRQKLGEENPDTLYGMHRLAKFYYDSISTDQAKALYKEIAKLDSKTPNALNKLAWPLVFVPNQQGNFPLAEQATAWARQACELAPKDGNLRNTLAVALFRTQAWKEAIEVLRESIESGFDTPHNWLFLAMSHWHIDEKIEAQQWYEKSLAWQIENLEAAKSDAELPFFFAEASALMAP